MAKEREAKNLKERVADPDALRERIAQRAYELYEERGREDGFDAHDWLRAEQEMLSQPDLSDTSAADERDKSEGQTPIMSKTAKP